MPGANLASLRQHNHGKAAGLLACLISLRKLEAGLPLWRLVAFTFAFTAPKFDCGNTKSHSIQSRQY